MPGVDPQGSQKYWGPKDQPFVGVKTGTIDTGAQKYWGPKDQPAQWFTPQTGTNFPALTVAP